MVETFFETNRWNDQQELKTSHHLSPLWGIFTWRDMETQGVSLSIEQLRWDLSTGSV